VVYLNGCIYGGDSPLLTAGENNNLNGETVPVNVGGELTISLIIENSVLGAGSSTIRHYISTNSIISTFDTEFGSSSVTNSMRVFQSRIFPMEFTMLDHVIRVEILRNVVLLVE